MHTRTSGSIPKSLVAKKTLIAHSFYISIQWTRLTSPAIASKAVLTTLILKMEAYGMGKGALSLVSFRTTVFLGFERIRTSVKTPGGGRSNMFSRGKAPRKRATCQPHRTGYLNRPRSNLPGQHFSKNAALTIIICMNSMTLGHILLRCWGGRSGGSTDISVRWRDFTKYRLDRPQAARLYSQSGSVRSRDLNG